ncbi:uncharacterized protein RHO17_004640 [Thomomys bottae]
MIGCARCEASKYVLNTRTFAGQRTVGRKNQNGEFDLIRRQWLIPWPGCLRRNPRYIPQYGDILAPSLADPCKAGYLRGGKVKQLVEHLVPALLFGDASFVPVFLGTYRTFTTTQHILTLLFSRYSSFQQLEGEKAGAKGPLQQAFAFILGSWMREYPEDFLEAPDSSCLQQLVAYLHLNMPGSIEEHQACLLLTHLELRNPKQPELEAGIEDIKPCAGALAAISEPGGPNPLEPSTLEPGNDEEVPVSTPESQLPQGKAEANPPSAPTPAAGADQAEAPMSTVAETCVLVVAAAEGRFLSAVGPLLEEQAACLLAGEVACLPPAVEEPEPTAQEPVPPIEEEAPGPSVPQAACLPTANEEPEPSAQEPVPPIEEEAPGPSVPQAACLPTANEEPEPSAQEPVPPIEEEAPGPPVPQAASPPTAYEEPEPSAQEPVPPIEEEAPGPSVPQAASPPTAYEEPEPSAQEPVPPIEEEAPGPSVPQAACLPTANEEPEPSAQEPVPPIVEEAPGPPVPQAASPPTAYEEPEPSAQEPVPLIEEEAPGPCVPQAASPPTAYEEPEPSAQEPVPLIEEEAPGPSSPLEKDAEGFREVVYPLPGNDQGHGLSISEDTRATLLSAAELEPDSVPLAREAHMGTETDPAPWESLTVGDFQISSRGPSRISLLKLEEMSTAHLVEWLPDQKAEQFAIMAVRLFKELKPYHCLSYVYSDPDKKCQELLAPTVLAILQFCERIKTCVITTSVLDHSAEAADRAEVLEHWIEVALESHHLKNAISVCAILSALQSSALQGLKQTWRAVSRGSLEVWQELRKIYSMEKHYKVGPQSTRMAFWSKLKRGLGTQKELDYSEGTVPYLGTILNHLASLHHHKDKDSKNGKWIHMQRRREEYKVLALIKELQGACQELHVVPEEKFVTWFTNLKRLSPSECDKLCQELEPPRWASFLCRKSRKSKKSLVQRKPSKDHQTSSKTFSSHSSSQLNTSEEVSIRSISHETSGHLGFSTRPSILYRRGYHSTPNISNSKIDFQYEVILGFLSPQPSRRTGHEGIY